MDSIFLLKKSSLDISTPHGQIRKASIEIRSIPFKMSLFAILYSITRAMSSCFENTRSIIIVITAIKSPGKINAKNDSLPLNERWNDTVHAYFPANPLTKKLTAAEIIYPKVLKLHLRHTMITNHEISAAGIIEEK